MILSKISKFLLVLALVALVLTSCEDDNKKSGGGASVFGVGGPLCKLVSEIDNTGDGYKYEYDSLGRLTKESFYVDAGNKLDNNNEYVYNNGVINIIHTDNAGLKWVSAFILDPSGRVLMEAANGDTVFYKYDNNGYWTEATGHYAKTTRTIADGNVTTYKTEYFYDDDVAAVTRHYERASDKFIKQDGTALEPFLGKQSKNIITKITKVTTDKQSKNYTETYTYTYVSSSNGYYTSYKVRYYNFANQYADWTLTNTYNCK